MKDFIARSRSLEETAQSKKGLIWILELLVFVAVFFVATIAQSLLIGPVQMVALMSDKVYMDAANSGDTQEAMRIMMEAAERIQSSDWFMIFMLFSDIAMIAIVFLFLLIICYFFVFSPVAAFLAPSLRLFKSVPETPPRGFIHIKSPALRI